MQKDRLNDLRPGDWISFRGDSHVPWISEILRVDGDHYVTLSGRIHPSNVIEARRAAEPVSVRLKVDTTQLDAAFAALVVALQSPVTIDGAGVSKAVGEAVKRAVSVESVGDVRRRPLEKELEAAKAEYARFRAETIATQEADIAAPADLHILADRLSKRLNESEAECARLRSTIELLNRESSILQEELRAEREADGALHELARLAEALEKRLGRPIRPRHSVNTAILEIRAADNKANGLLRYAERLERFVGDPYISPRPKDCSDYGCGQGWHAAACPMSGRRGR
jgi:hypothetical protein